MFHYDQAVKVDCLYSFPKAKAEACINPQNSYQCKHFRGIGSISYFRTIPLLSLCPKGTRMFAIREYKCSTVSVPTNEMADFRHKIEVKYFQDFQLLSLEIIDKTMYHVHLWRELSVGSLSLPNPPVRERMPYHCSRADLLKARDAETRAVKTNWSYGFSKVTQ
jgi:hypothetical protein